MVKRVRTESQAVPTHTSPIARCGNCGNNLAGYPWTQSPKGRVCDYCWQSYFHSHEWPKVGANA